MAASAGRIRRGGNRGFQGVSMADNWRTAWYVNQETAQKHLDEHIAKLKGRKTSDLPPAGGDTPDQPFVDQDASDIPPGGQDTGPRG